jgi:MFS family permease
VLAVTVLGSGIAALDATVVSIALPTIGRDFHASAYLHPDALAAGFRTAVLISGALCAAGGLLAAVTITNPARGHRPAGAAVPDQCLHCGLDAPPLTTSVSPRE